MPPVLTAQAAEQRQKAAELAERYTGWHVWPARAGKAKVATRTGQRDPGDGIWVPTLICDTWDQLDKELAEQAQADADRTYPETRP